MQVAKVCTSGLEYTIEEFIDSLTRSIAEEDNELLERMEHMNTTRNTSFSHLEYVIKSN